MILAEDRIEVVTGAAAERIEDTAIRVTSLFDFSIIRDPHRPNLVFLLSHLRRILQQLLDFFLSFRIARSPED